MSSFRLAQRYARHFRSCLSRCNSTDASTLQIPPLPDIDTWTEVFPVALTAQKERVHLRRPETAAKVAEAFLSDEVMTEGRPKVIIEAFPGEVNLGSLELCTLT